MNFTNLEKEFSPSIMHPYYFIRHGIKDGVLKYAGHMHGKMMDFGCGSKPYKSFYSVTEYSGVDYENEGHPHDNEPVDVFYDGNTLPFENNYFDCVLCSEVLEHVFNIDRILQEINRVTKINGKILITCPFVWNEHEQPHDFARYTRFALQEIMNRHGFEIIEYSKAGNFIICINQLITLYFFNVHRGLWKKVFLLRWIYKIAFYLFPNIITKGLNKILPFNDSLYLNNILVAKKINESGKQTEV